MSNEEAPFGRIDTMASGHSGDGTKAHISDEPQTSTATKAPKPNAKETIIPMWRLLGGIRLAASSGRTESALFIAINVATSARIGIAAAHMQDLWEPDGIHVKPGFYVYWANSIYDAIRQA